MRETEKIWMNGTFVDWADAKIHVATHGLHYGTGVFEGIRAYDTARGPAVFRLRDHMQRLHNSAKLLYMDIPYSVDDLVQATYALLEANRIDECYIRPIAYFGYGELGVATRGNPVDVVVAPAAQHTVATLVVVAALMRNGCSYEEAWTMPEAEAIWLHVAHAQAAGAKIDVVSDKEWEAMRKYEQEQAEQAKNQTQRN